MMHAASTAYSISAPVLSCCSRVIAGRSSAWPSAARSIICPPAMPAGPGRARQLEHQLGRGRTGPHGSRDAARISNASAWRLSPASTAVGFAERLVDGRLAAPQIVIVHARQIVVDQRIDVDRLDRRSRRAARARDRSRTGAPRRRSAAGRSRLPPPIAAWRIASYSRSRLSPGGASSCAKKPSTSARHAAGFGVELGPASRSRSQPASNGFDARRLAVGAERDLLDPRLRRLQPRLAMALQPVAALVELDRLVERRLALLERAHDLLELGQRRLEAQFARRRSAVSIADSL